MMHGIVLIGASGHAKVVIELFRARGKHVAYCIGTDPKIESCLDVSVLVGDHHIARLREDGFEDAFVAVGSNRLRARLAEFALQAGFNLVNAISPNATISPTVRLGRGIAVMAGAIINADSRIDDLAIINTAATIDHDCVIGRAVHIAPQCALAGNVVVGEYAFLGIGTTVVPSMNIGIAATVGAGGVVIADIAANVVAFGVPAQQRHF